MQLGVVKQLAVAAVVVVSAAACGDSGSTAASSGDHDGAALYSVNCASCHGADFRGSDEGPSFLSVVYEPGHHSDASFRAAIRNGAPQHHWDFGPMPPVEGLDDAEIEAIIDFVRSEQQRRGFEG